jgi:hypothetical protein
MTSLEIRVKMTNKTRDGIKLKTLVKSLEKIVGVTIRAGTNHPYVAEIRGHATSCPIAASTNARTMVVPWVRRYTNYSNSNEIYDALKTGEWPR